MKGEFMEKLKIFTKFKKMSRYQIIGITIFLLGISLFLLNYFLTYGEYTTKPASRIEGNTVYINDLASDYYYYLGMNYVGDLYSNTVNYNDTNLKMVTINYYGHSQDITSCDINNCGYVSLDEPQYKFTYYKYFPVNNGYIEFELIDNPFSSRPLNKGFGGWTSSIGTITTNSNTNVSSLKVSAISDELIIDLYANWVEANVVYLKGSQGDDNFDGKSPFNAVASWGKAFELLKSRTSDNNNREINIVVLTGDLNHSINYTIPVTHTYDTTINYSDKLEFTNNLEYIIEYVLNGNRYALTDNATIDYTLLSSTIEPSDNVKWRIVNSNGGYTIQNSATGNYLSFEKVGEQFNLIASTTPTLWQYDSAIRSFYYNVTLDKTEYSYTAQNTFDINSDYYLANVDGENINALTLNNNNFINTALTINTTPSDTFTWRLGSYNGNYLMRNNATGEYLTIVDNGNGSGNLATSTNVNNALWEYDITNQAFHRTVSIRHLSVSYTNSTTIRSGTYYLTTGGSNNISSLASNYNNSLQTEILTTNSSPSDYAKWTLTSQGQGYIIRNNANNNYLYYANNSLNIGTTTTSWRYNNGRFYYASGRTNYYLTLNGDTWTVTTNWNNATTIYLTTANEVENYSDTTYYLSYISNNWGIDENISDNTRIYFVTSSSNNFTVTSDYYLRFNNGFELSTIMDNNSLNFATYNVDREIINTTQGNITSNSNYTKTNNIAVTITSLYNGIDYRDDATLSLTTVTNQQASIIAFNDLQLEYLKINANGYNAINNNNTSTAYQNRYATLVGNNHNVRLGRGLTPNSWTDNTSAIFCYAYGGSNSSSVGSTTNDNNQYRFVIESGRYSSLMVSHIRNDSNITSTNYYNYYGEADMILGNDYDRVSNNNDLLDVFYRSGSSNSYGVSGQSDVNQLAYLIQVKSGKYGVYYFDNYPNDDERAYSGIYVGGLTVTAGNNARDISSRVILVEGGEIANIVGGLRITSQDATSGVKTKIYVKGGIVDNIVGGAGVSTTYGDRFISVTGGEISYSVSGGSNGYLATSTTGQDNGRLQGDTNVHIGGNAKVGTALSGTLYGVSYGSVLGAGNGNSNIKNSGQANKSTVSISGEALIYGNVYGGGNYGNIVTDVDINIDGGVIEGSVYGGANQNGVGTVDIQSGVVTNVVYKDYTTFTPLNNYLITHTANSNRNALNTNNLLINNRVLTDNVEPSATSNWTVIPNDDKYLIKNVSTNNYLVAKPSTTVPDLITSSLSDNGIWEYDKSNHTFHQPVEMILSSNVTYTFNNNFLTGQSYLITNSNSVNSAVSLVGGSSISNITLSNTVIPSDEAMWIIDVNNGAYTIKNAITGQYIGYQSNGGFFNITYTLIMTDEAVTWSYNSTNRMFYNNLSSSIFQTANFYITYNNGWTMGTSGTSLYFGTYEAVNETFEREYYLGYDNGWVLTTTNTSINQLTFTQYNSTSKTTITASNKQNGNVNINMTNGEIKETLYGGSCLKGDIAGLITMNVTGGTIGYNSDHNGSIFGGGYGENTNVASGVILNVNDTNYNLTIGGDVYGGSALGSVIDDIKVTVRDVSNDTKIDAVGNFYCGSMGDSANSTTGTITGNCDILIAQGVYPGSVYGGNNANGSPGKNITVTVGGESNLSDITNVYGGGNQADSEALSVKVYIKNNSLIDNVFGGGNSANVDVTNVYLQGGNITNAFGGSNNGDIETTNVSLEGSNVTNIYGGSNSSGTIQTTNIITSLGQAETIYGGNNLGGSTNNSNITINGAAINTCYGGGNLAVTSTTYINVNAANITDIYGGGNKALTDQSYIYLNNGSITNVYGGGNQAGMSIDTNIYQIGSTVDNIFGGSNNSGDVLATNILVKGGQTTTIYGGNNAGGLTDVSNITIEDGDIETCYGGGKLATTNETNIQLISGNIPNVYGGGESADIEESTNVNLIGSTTTNIYGGSNTSGTVLLSNINISGGSATNIYGGNNAGGQTTTTKIKIDDGLITNVYGGGNQANTGSSNITLNNNSSVITSIYGGGYASDVTTVNIILNNGNASSVYGGSNNSGTITTSNILVNDGTFNIIYGGNNAGGLTENANIQVLGGRVTDIYGGGNNAETNNPIVQVNNATIEGSIYGGGNNASVRNNTNVQLTNATVKGNVFGGGNNGKVFGNTNVNIKSSTINKSAYAGGNGTSAVVSLNTNITVHGSSHILGHVFGGGNAAATGSLANNNSQGSVNITGGIIEGNVYGGANTSVLYGETTVNIGYKAVTGVSGVDVSVTYDEENDTYTNNEAVITLNSTFRSTTGGYWNNFLNIHNISSASLQNYTLVLYTGENTLSQCYNCNFTIDGEYTTITPVINWEGQVTLEADQAYDLSGTWNLVDASQISVVGYYSEHITDPIINGNSEYERGDITILGTVFGGGEANASGSENYDYSFISITKGITINIDGINHDVFDIAGSIFGSGNASSTTGYSNIYIRNYGSLTDIKDNISIQRADLVVLDNSNIELFGATDRTNEFSTTLFSLSRIKELKLKNNSSLYLQNGANLLEKFSSLVDIDDQEILATVDIDKDKKTVTKNVNNRLYIVEDKVLNIATNQNVTAYGEVDGMTFFGMYRHDRNGNIVTAMYDTNYNYGDTANTGDLYYFSSGTYVLGMHEVNHNIKVDGFYSNFADTENEGSIYIDYITPTPENGSYYMWTIGVQVISYDIDLIASKYSTLGTQELQLINYAKENTYFSVVGFTYDALDPNLSLVDPESIPRIANTSSEADNTMGLSIKTGTNGWITLGSTIFLTDENKLYDGTINYYTENSTVAPSLIFYLYHSKNLMTEGNLGTAVISLLAITPVDALTNTVERININVSISRALYDSNDYEGTMTPGREYEMFSSSKTDVTTTSSISAYYSLFVNSETNIYREGYHRVLSSSLLFPVNTKITMIDFASGDKPVYYYYVVNEEDNNALMDEYNAYGTASYPLSKFIKMGSSSPTNNYDDATANQTYYRASQQMAYEEFIFIVDFKDSNLASTYLNNSLLIELRTDTEQTLYTVLGIQHDSLIYNLYYDQDAVIEVDAELDKDVVYLGETAQLTVTTNFNQQIDSQQNTIIDTNFYEKKLGVKLTFFDQNGNQVNGVDLMGISLSYNNQLYYPRSDGTIRINLAERVANVKSIINISTLNSNLTSGTYSILVESFYSPDGIYFGIESSDQATVSFDVYEKIYGLEVNMDDNTVIIDSTTGYTLNNDNLLNFDITYSSGLINPNIRLAMYRRNYNDIYSSTYDIVNINDYITTTLVESNEPNIFKIFNAPRNHETLQLYLKEKLTTGTYKLEFILYDNDTFIGEVSKYIIIK